MSKHMNDLKFTPGKNDALPWSSDDHPACAGLIYLDVEASDSFISGWVKPEIAMLVKAAPDLLEALSDMVSGAAANESFVTSNGENPRLARARAAIAHATGEQP